LVELPGKAAGQGCRANMLPGKAAGQACRARLLNAELQIANCKLQSLVVKSGNVDCLSTA
jgi:hypothetical protein